MTCISGSVRVLLVLFDCEETANCQTTKPIQPASSTTFTTVQSPAAKSRSRSNILSINRRGAVIPKSTYPPLPPMATTDSPTGAINGDLGDAANQKFNTSAEAQKALNYTLNLIDKSNTQYLNAESVYLCSKILTNAAEVKNISNDVFHIFLQITDVLLDLSSEQFHGSDVDNNQGQTGNSTIRIAKSFENLVFNSENATVSYLTGNNVAIVAQSVDQGQSRSLPQANGLLDCGSDGFLDNSENSNCENGNPRVSVSIPGDAIKNSNATKLFFIIYRNRNLFDQRRPVPPENADPCDDRIRLPSSHVVTATLLDGSNSSTEVHYASDMGNAVIIKYDLAAIYKELDQSPPLHGKHQPSYWDWNTLNWSMNGCVSVSSENGIFEGHCNHLTDFTIIFEGTKYDPILCNYTIKLTGYILSGMSSLALFILIGIFIGARVTALRSIRLVRALSGSQARVRLLGLPYLATLFCFFLIFTIFVDQNAVNTSDIDCRIVAGVLYTCLISVVLLTIVQGLEIVKRFFVFTRAARVLEIVTNVYFSSLICTGIPVALTVVLWIMTDDFFSRSDGFCWIRPDYVLFGVVLPTSLFVLNDVLLTMIIVYQLFFVNQMGNDENSKKIQTPAARKKELSRKIVVLTSMQLILGAPWVLEYFTIGEPKLVFSHILFTVFNGSQGFLLGLIYLLTRYKQRTSIYNIKDTGSSEVQTQITGYEIKAAKNLQNTSISVAITEVISESSSESSGQLDISVPSIH